MRVIGGAYRSRVLTAPRGSATRPTSDRLRETLFNVLAARIDGARFADLYAGSGAVGIEALSRGAEHVWFAEKSAPAVAVIRKNLLALGIGNEAEVEQRTAAALLERIAQRGAAKLDLVFLDPPWEATGEYDALLRLLGGELGQRILAAGALVIAEHAARVELPQQMGDLVRTRVLKQGDASLSFFGQE